MRARGQPKDPRFLDFQFVNYSDAYGTYLAGNGINKNTRTLVSPYLVGGEDTAIILSLGQSIEANYTDGAYSPTNPTKIQQMHIYDGGIYLAEDPLLSIDGTMRSYLTEYADRLIISGRYERVIIVPTNVGGSYIAQWKLLPEGPFNHRLGVAKVCLDAAGLAPTHIVIGDGTTNNSLNTPRAEFRTDLQSIIDEMQGYWPAAKVLVTKETWVAGDLDYDIRDAQQDVVDEENGVFEGSDKDMIGDRYDAAHLNDDGGHVASLKLVGRTIDADLYASDLIVDINAQYNRVKVPGQAAQTLNSYFTTTRALQGFVEDRDGFLTKFPANEIRWSNLGILVEIARTNFCLHNRDLTNAAWVKVNTAAALTSPGADGISNGASLLAGNGTPNGTCLQTIVVAAGDKFVTAYLKRFSGAGVIEMTMDNVTWTDVSAGLSFDRFRRVSVPTQNIGTMTVGFRIVNGTDVIIVDMVQAEESIFATSPIETTTVAVARPSDIISKAGLAIPATVSILAEMIFRSPTANTSNQIPFILDDGAGTHRYTFRRDATTGQPTIVFTVAGAPTTWATTLDPITVQDTIFRFAMGFANADQVIVEGFSGDQSINTVTPIPSGPLSRLVIGSNGAGGLLNGYITRMKFYDSRLPTDYLTPIAA